MAGRRRGRAAILLDAAPSSILAFEAFVDSLSFLSRSERDRLIVAGGETLDNVIKHGSPLRLGRVRASVRREAGASRGVALTFRFGSRSFAAFARGLARDGPRAPRFDAEHRRWSGLGLAMCRNLARRVDFLPGALGDRIVLAFDPCPGDPGPTP